MYLETIIENLESNLQHLKRTQRKMDVMQQALGRFDAMSDTGWSALEGSYHYIPLDLGEFVESLTELNDHLLVDPHYKHKTLPYRPVHFLEVGCGIGRNLFVVKHGSGLQLKSVTGIDIAPQYIAQAKRFFFMSDQEALIADAFAFDYSKYDVVYFYRPFSDEVLEGKFERRLIRQLRPGAYIVGHLNAALEKSRALRQKEGSYRIWQKR